MKKILLGLAMSFFLLSSASASEFNSNIRFGSKGSEVKKLQEFLVDQGLYTGPITGNFFSLTLKAVKAFQLREQIAPVSGYFGVLTRAKANGILDSQLADLNAEANEPVVEPKTTDDVVSKLNEQLALQKTQNDLLQQQIRNQQGALDQIVMNTTPVAPVVKPTKRGIVMMAGNVKTATGRRSAIDQYVKGHHTDDNRELINIFEPMRWELRPVNYFVGASNNLRVLLNINESSEVIDGLKCEKTGDWSGPISPITQWHENVGTADLTPRILNYGISCTSQDGSVSSDYIEVNLTTSTPYNP